MTVGAGTMAEAAEVAVPGPFPMLRVEVLEAAEPALVAGITWRGGAEPVDMGLYGTVPVGTALSRWRALREATGFRAAIHARQVHGARVLCHDGAPAGLLLCDDADGHVTREPGVLITVSVADCVPIWVVAPGPEVALLHAGWRGIAAGILEAGLDALGPGRTGQVRVHLGPAICGACYEVGPEVHAALGRPVPGGPTPIDLRAVLIERCVRAGVPAAAISRSALCTRCDGDRLFSHRGGSAGRQIAFAGIRPDGP